jgi:hypothetical protein
MSLDLAKVALQIEDMVSRLKASGRQRQRSLQQALNTLNDESIDLEQLKGKIIAAKTSWLVAELVEELNRHYQAPPLPAEFTVIATDGSQIDVDRHHSVPCYLINIGRVTLNYGSRPSAIINSQPHLYSDDQELVITPPEGIGREQSIEGVLLGIKRSVEECMQLVQMAARLPSGSSALALLDGSLILWGLISKDYPEFVLEELLDKGFISCLNEVKELNKYRRVAIASYISFPRSTDVVNTLRIAICPNDVSNCDHYCADSTSGKRECDIISGVQDRELFYNLLAEGERSALFISRSSIVRGHYGIHRVYFFYLRVDDEIARIEIPEWVATDKNLMALVHSLILDQCRRGHGYPVALSEAHEKAVVTGIDRESFQHLLEMSLADEHMPITTSAKSLSKRTRWV